jgi:predicted TIM-barrel fold metal-dependent hydrolase
MHEPNRDEVSVRRIVRRRRDISRRDVVAGGLALGAGSLLVGAAARAQAPRLAAGTIDVHHHFFPPVLQEATFRMLAGVYGDIPARIKDWSPARAIEALDKNGVAQAVISTSSRPVRSDMTLEQNRAQARACNEFGARMVQDHPKRFAQFGFVPMPDVEGSLREIEYALDVLKAPGIGMMTSYGSRWQGHHDFTPVLEELNRRKAVVFCHPLPAACCTALMPDTAPREPLLVEFPYDTGRAVSSLLMTGSFVKYRDIRWIFCHCGGVVPALSGRMRNAISEMPQDRVAQFAPQGIDYEFRRLFYDTADAAYAPSMAAIMSYVPTSQILFGTDYPFVRIETDATELHQRQLTSAEMAAIQRDNILRLMPQLA